MGDVVVSYLKGCIAQDWSQPIGRNKSQFAFLTLWVWACPAAVWCPCWRKLGRSQDKTNKFPWPSRFREGFKYYRVYIWQTFWFPSRMQKEELQSMLPLATNIVLSFSWWFHIQILNWMYVTGKEWLPLLVPWHIKTIKQLKQFWRGNQELQNR